MNRKGWALAAIDKGGRDVAVALLPDGAMVAIDALPEGIAPIDVVRQWATYGPILEAWSPASSTPVEGGRLLAPIRFPSKLIMVGVNFADHRQEMDAERDPDGNLGEVFMFLKPPTTAIVGPDDDVLTRGPQDMLDWEAEIGVVIGKGGRFIEQSDALDHVAGYILINDISVRGEFQRPNPCHPAVEWDWVSQKAQDTHCPTGPAMMPSWFIPEPDNIPFSLTLNGVEEQNGNTGELVHNFRKMIAAASEYMTLEPGDIIATGTCGGVGLAKNRFMKPGDVVIVKSPLLGELRNTIRQIDRPACG